MEQNSNMLAVIDFPGIINILKEKFDKIYFASRFVSVVHIFRVLLGPSSLNMLFDTQILSRTRWLTKNKYKQISEWCLFDSWLIWACWALDARGQNRQIGRATCLESNEFLWLSLHDKIYIVSVHIFSVITQCHIRNFQYYFFLKLLHQICIYVSKETATQPWKAANEA